MRRLCKLIIDTWGALSYKPAFRAAASGGPTSVPGATTASWVPATDRRRLAAYTVLAAYDTNQAAVLLSEDGDDGRKYGDAFLIVDQTMSHLLGESQHIVVDDAEDEAVAQDREALLRDWVQAEHLRMRMQHASEGSSGPEDVRSRLLLPRPARRRTRRGRLSGARPPGVGGPGGSESWAKGNPSAGDVRTRSHRGRRPTHLPVVQPSERHHPLPHRTPHGTSTRSTEPETSTLSRSPVPASAPTRTATS